MSTAMSCRLALRFSPKPGALTATTCTGEEQVSGLLAAGCHSATNLAMPAGQPAPAAGSRRSTLIMSWAPKRTLTPARSLLTISVASASLSTSSATITSGRCTCTTFSSTGRMAWSLLGGWERRGRGARDVQKGRGRRRELGVPRCREGESAGQGEAAPTLFECLTPEQHLSAAV